MKSTTVAIVAVLLLFVFRLDPQVFVSASIYGNQYYDDDDAAAMASDYKRAGKELSKDLCIPWRAQCPSDFSLVKKYHFLRCCTGMTCKCTLFGNNCKCESRLGR